jgi:tetratricopeptide (TPR) repeat protein
MEKTNLFSEIGRVLPPAEVKWVLPALRHSPLVWQSLEQADFLQTALQQAGSQASKWSPGALALLMVADIQPELLQVEPMIPLSQTLQEKAVRVYQSTQRTSEPPETLRDASLLALALRERRRLTGTWSGLLQEILPKPGQAEQFFSVWRAPLACLYSYIPDPEEMLRGLLPKHNRRGPFEWIVLTQLSQPVSEQQHTQAFTRLLAGVPAASQLNVLRSLAMHGCEPAAGQVAENLLVGHPAFASVRAHTSQLEPDLAHLSNRALALQQMGAFYQLSGDTKQALALYEATESTIEQWLSGLAVQRLNLQAAGPDDPAAFILENRQISQLASASGWLKDELGAALVSHPGARSVIDELPENGQNPLLQLKIAEQMFEQEPAVARDLAHQSAGEILTQIREHFLPFNCEFVYSWRPQDVIVILLKLGLPQEALQISQAVMAVRPADTGLLNLAGKALEQVGDIEQGIRVAQTGAALEPENPHWRRVLGSLWQRSGAHGAHAQAYEAWKTALGLSGQPSLDDRLNCALAALHAGYMDEAVTIGEEVLAVEPGSGATLGLLGRAMVKKGDLRKAVEYLVQSTLFNPELVDSWLALAGVQQALGETQRAIETLHSAVTALPESAETHLAYGKACVKAGMMADALPQLKKAFMLSPELDGAALAYSQALVKLGHITEARAVLERVRSLWTAHPELAYSFAWVLLEQHNPEGALPVLEAAIANGLIDVDAYLLYARVLLGEYHRVEESLATVKARGRIPQAEQALRQILDIEPNNLEARLLIADIRWEKEDLDMALSMYQDLVDLAAGGPEDIRGRAQWGLGRTALRLGKTDIAVAAMQEACQARPDHIQQQRGLAEAMLQANLRQEALDAATLALNLAPDVVENLSWYAAFTAHIGEPQKAVEALERAVQITPNRADLLVDLAHHQVSAGDLQGAAVSLQKVGELEAVSGGDLRRSAQMFLRLQQPAGALVFFERALLFEPVPADLFSEVAELQQRLGNIPAALDLAQKALEQNPQNMPVYLLQADLLTRSDRPQAALALLERGLRLAENLPAPQNDLLCEIHHRFANLLLIEGNVNEALDHAEKALACKPACAEFCYQAVELALALAQNEHADRIMWAYMTEEETRRAWLYDQGKEGLNLLALQIEMALDNGQDQAARAGVEEGLAQVSDNPRFLAANSRLLAREGEVAAARRLYEYVREYLKKGRTGPLEYPALWLADAALEAQQWQDAVGMYERYAQAHPASALGQIRLARSLVISAEKQCQCEQLSCRGNAPGPQALREDKYQKFEEAMRAAEQLANSVEIRRWRVRAEAVFTPGAQSARGLAALPPTPGETAALIAVLRRINNLPAAMQLSRRYSSDPSVLTELVLCHLSQSAEEGLDTAKRLVEIQPGNPLGQAALAVLNGKIGEINQSLDAYENALKAWDNEPAWHDAAGDLCAQVGLIEKGIEHRKKALDLDPECADYAFKLGDICLGEEKITEAVEYLEKAAALNPQMGNAWLELATAYLISKRFPQALDAARQAIALDAMSADSMMIAGETALSMGDLNLALEYGRDAVRCAPDAPITYLFMANVMSLLNQKAEAITLLKQAPQEVRESFPVSFELARLIYKVHGAKPALDLLEKMSKDYVEEPGLLSFLAQVQAECGEIQSAERNAFKALRLDPNQPELTLMLGRLQHKTGQLDQAVHLLSEVIRMAPEVLEAYLELGSVFQRRREYMQALQVYRQAMKAAPQDYQAYYQSGLILRDSKDYSGAEAMLRRAADRAPENLSIRRQLVGVIALNLVHSKQEASVP